MSPEALTVYKLSGEPFLAFVDSVTKPCFLFVVKYDAVHGHWTLRNTDKRIQWINDNIYGEKRVHTIIGWNFYLETSEILTRVSAHCDMSYLHTLDPLNTYTVR